MDALLALDSLTSGKTQPYLSSACDASSLSPPPSFSRLPPDGHEFPTNYQEPNHFNVGVPAVIEMDLKLEKLTVESMLMKPCNDTSPPPLPSSVPPQKKASFKQEFNPAPPTPARHHAPVHTEEAPTRSRPVSWRTDQKSEQSVRDKIAMFASQKDNAAPQVAQTTQATRRLSNTFKSSENIFYDEDTVDCSSGSLPSGKLLSRSVISVDKISPPHSSLPYRQPTSSSVTTAYVKDFGSFGGTGDVVMNSHTTSNDESPRSLDYNTTRALSSMDLLSSSSSAYSSCSPDSSLSSSSSYAVSYSSTLPRNLSSGRPTPVASSYGTTPRKTSAVEMTRTPNLTASNGNSLHTRSQSLVDVAARPTRHSIGHDASRASAEDMRRASLNALIEQRRRGMSKLRGLVIPEKVAEVAPSNQCVFDLPEIKSRESILATKPPLLTKDDTRFVTSDRQNVQTNSWSSSNMSYPSLEKTTSLTSTSTNLSSPPWKNQTPASNLPKYSPAFKRKSLAVCGTSSTASSVSSSLNSSREELRPYFEGNNGKQSMPPPPPIKPPRNPTTITSHIHSRSSIPANYNSQFLYNPEPPKSLESLTSPTRSDSSFEYTRTNSPDQRANKNDVVKNNCTILNDDHKKVLLSPSNKSMSDRGRSGEDDSDNDSAVSSSRSSISHDFSPPQSPLPDNQSRDSQHHTTRQHILLSPLPSSGNGMDRRPLRRTLSSETTASAASSTASTLTSGSQASCSSNGGSSSDNGRRVLKAQSVEAINRKNVLSSARYSSGRDLKVGSPLIKRKFEDEEERSDADEREEEDVTLQDDSDLDQCNGDGSVESKDVMFYSSYSQGGMQENGVRVAYIDIMTSESGYDAQEDMNHDTAISNGEFTELIKVDIPALIPTAAPRRSNNSTSEDIDSSRLEDKTPTKKVDIITKTVSTEPHKRAYLVEAMVQTAMIEKKHHIGDDLIKVSTQNGLDTNGNGEPIVPCKQLSRKSSSNMQRETTDVTACDKDLMNLLAGPQRIQRQKSKEDVVKLTEKIPDVISPPAPSRIPTTSSRNVTNRRSVSVNDIRKAFEKAELALSNSGRASIVNGSAKPANGNGVFSNHARVSSLDSTTSEDSCAMTAQYGSVTNLQREQFGSITSLASSTSLISQQELQVLIDEANQALEEQGGGCPPVHEVLVVILHRELTGGSVGITLAGGADYEAKEITVHKVLGGSAADRDGRIQKGDRILSINGKSMKGVTHRESLNILKAPRTEVILVISRPRGDSVDGLAISSRPPRIPEQPQEGSNSSGSESESASLIARGPPVAVTLLKEGAGLGFSLEGGKDSPLGDKPLIIKKLFMGGIADKCGQIRAGDELLKVNELDITSMSRIEAWGLMKKLPDGKVSLTVRHKVENNSR